MLSYTLLQALQGEKRVMGTRKDSRHQQEADKTVEATLRDIDKIEAALDEHGLPLRVDSYGDGNTNTWTFDDNTKIEIKE